MIRIYGSGQKEVLKLSGTLRQAANRFRVYPGPALLLRRGEIYSTSTKSRRTPTGASLGTRCL